MTSDAYDAACQESSVTPDEPIYEDEGGSLCSACGFDLTGHEECPCCESSADKGDSEDAHG